MNQQKYTIFLKSPTEREDFLLGGMSGLRAFHFLRRDAEAMEGSEAEVPGACFKKFKNWNWETNAVSRPYWKGDKTGHKVLTQS